MDIHKPKPVHSWREFAIEIATIITGILLALGAEQTVEAFHWSKLVKEGRAELREELGVQVNAWSYRVRIHACNVQRLKDIDGLLNDLAAGKRVPRIAAFSRPFGAKTPQAVWRGLSASGVLSHLDSKELLTLSQIYSTDDSAPAWSQANDIDWSTISLIVGDSNSLPVTDRNLIRVAVSRELLLEQVWDVAGRDQIERARKLGVTASRPSSGAYAAGSAPECRPLQRG